MHYFKHEIHIIRTSLPEPDFHIKNKDDPFSLIRGLLDLYIEDSLISLEIVLACPIFQQFARKNEAILMKLIDDRIQRDEDKKIAQQHQREDDLADVIDELVAQQESANKLVYYDIKLEKVGGLTTYMLHNTMKEIVRTIREWCAGISPYLDERLQVVLNELYKECKIKGRIYEDVFSLHMQFYLSSGGELRIALYEGDQRNRRPGEKSNNIRFDKWLTDNREDIVRLLQRIGYKDMSFSLYDTLQRERDEDVDNFDTIDE